jgi:hypothetical protein
MGRRGGRGRECTPTGVKRGQASRGKTASPDTRDRTSPGSDRPSMENLPRRAPIRGKPPIVPGRMPLEMRRRRLCGKRLAAWASASDLGTTYSGSTRSCSGRTAVPRCAGCTPVASSRRGRAAAWEHGRGKPDERQDRERDPRDAAEEQACFIPVVKVRVCGEDGQKWPRHHHCEGSETKRHHTTK